jgi:hypothetical protein
MCGCSPRQKSPPLPGRAGFARSCMEAVCGDCFAVRTLRSGFRRNRRVSAGKCKILRRAWFVQSGCGKRQFFAIDLEMGGKETHGCVAGPHFYAQREGLPIVSRNEKSVNKIFLKAIAISKNRKIHKNMPIFYQCTKIYIQCMYSFMLMFLHEF